MGRRSARRRLLAMERTFQAEAAELARWERLAAELEALQAAGQPVPPEADHFLAIMATARADRDRAVAALAHARALVAIGPVQGRRRRSR